MAMNILSRFHHIWLRFSNGYYANLEDGKLQMDDTKCKNITSYILDTYIY